MLVGTCIEAIKELATAPGPAVLTIDTVIECLVEHPHIKSQVSQTLPTNTWHKYKAKVLLSTWRTFKEKVSWPKVFDRSLLPTSTDDIQKYRESYISQLSHHYGINDCTAQQECMGELSFSNEEYLLWHGHNWCFKNATSTKWTILCKFAQIAITLPVSNADSERGFSCMNRIKMQLHNHLTVPSLDTLMRISVEGPDISDFDFSHAVNKWASLRNRRVVELCAKIVCNFSF